MRTVLEVNESGELMLPADLLPVAVPHTRYLASLQGNQIVLAPAAEAEPFWKRATPQERAADILQWASNHLDGPNLPASAIGRDAIYE